MKRDNNQINLPVDLKEERIHPGENKLFFKILVPKTLLFLGIFLFTAVTYSQPVTKVLISGEYTAHDTDVKNAFLLGYASYDATQYNGQIDLHSDYTPYNALRYAHENGYQIAVRSYSGLNTTVDDSAKNYSDVLLFMPAGSNSYIYTCNIDVPNSAVVSTGAGVDSLVTGYEVEFFSVDPITNSNLSSFSNGYIAGQIAFMANHFNVSVSQARTLARNNTFINSQPSSVVVYGKIDEAKAVNAGVLPVELTSFSAAVEGKNVLLTWRTASEVKNYGFEIFRDGAKIGFVQGNGNSYSTKDYSFTDKPDGAKTFTYQLKQIDSDGQHKLYGSIEVTLAAPNAFVLYQNYPNPFNPTTTIKFEVPTTEKVTIKIYNMVGQEVATLLDGIKEAGSYEVKFDGSELSSGVYISSLKSSSFSKNIKMILMK
ncbi:MAG: T9SS type A sorting domain-containing protein [Ignavibacteriaceae bacterium]|jgi:hypothetical protein